MTEQTAKDNVGGKFYAFNVLCTVVSVATFSGVIHYGFTTELETLPCGWIPANLVGQTEW